MMGADFWGVLIDGLLRMAVPDSIILVGYVDDTATIIGLFRSELVDYLFAGGLDMFFMAGALGYENSILGYEILSQVSNASALAFEP